MDRRQFLRVTGASVLVGVAATGCEAAAEYESHVLVRPDLLVALGPEPVRAIGAEYRGMVSAEQDAESLRTSILASRPWTANLPGVAQPSIADLVRSDFEHGRTVVVRGWILSATEARQCALFSLLPA